MILNFCKICLKRVSIINLALLFVGETYACGWEPHHSPSRYPAFQFINTPLVRNYYEKETNWETIRYWYNYADGKIGMNEISDFINTATYADVKDRRDKNPFFRYLVEHNDTAAIGFLSESRILARLLRIIIRMYGTIASRRNRAFPKSWID